MDTTGWSNLINILMLVASVYIFIVAPLRVVYWYFFQYKPTLKTPKAVDELVNDNGQVSISDLYNLIKEQGRDTFVKTWLSPFFWSIFGALVPFAFPYVTKFLEGIH